MQCTMYVERQNRKRKGSKNFDTHVGNLNVAELLQDVLCKSVEFASRVQNGHNIVIIGTTGDDISLTEMRSKYAARILSTLFAYRSASELLTLENLMIGPVIHPHTGKKEFATPFKKYHESRLEQVRLRGKGDGDSITEEAIVEAVVCYDFLHTDLSKPVCLYGLVCENSEFEKADPPFREAVKIMYNRSRIVNILKKFQEAVNSKKYSPLPELHQTDFTLLKRPEEQTLLKKYIAKFFPMLEMFDHKHVEKIPAKLWQFFLLLSQDYSVYYGRCRSLSDAGDSQSNLVMHARIWLLKIILELYNCGCTLLNIKPVEYV